MVHAVYELNNRYLVSANPKKGQVLIVLLVDEVKCNSLHFKYELLKQLLLTLQFTVYASIQFRFIYYEAFLEFISKLFLIGLPFGLTCKNALAQYDIVDR